MKEYPKLVAIGMMPYRSDSAEWKYHRIYLIEDEHCFIGYARGLKDDENIRSKLPPVLKMGKDDIVALRWCNVAFPPKGDENIEQLYNEIHNIIKNDTFMHYAIEYDDLVKDNHAKKIFGGNVNPNNLITDSEKEAFKYY